MTNVQSQFIHVTALIQAARQRAFQAVNSELVMLYWSIGEYLHQQVASKVWGKAVVNQLADFIQQSEPNMKGFSPQNLWRMKQFYETYKDFPELAALWREVTWSNHRLIMPCKSPQEREFYLRLAISEWLSSRELERQIDSSYYERVMLADAKLAPLARVLPQGLTSHFKDTYVLEMLNLPDTHLERDLKHQISQNISKFLNEFERDFAFMGEEYPLHTSVSKDIEVWWTVS